MLRLASDADVHGDIIRGLLRRGPNIDLVRVQDAMRGSSSDEDVLAWSAEMGRVLVSNDRNTMTGSAYARLAAGQPLPGVIVTNNDQSIGRAIEDILLIVECMSEEEIRNQVVVF